MSVTCPDCTTVLGDDVLVCPVCLCDLVGRPVVAPMAVPAAGPAVASWVCSSPGCPDTVLPDGAACPICGAGDAPASRVRLTGAVDVCLDGPGPWTLGRAAPDSPELAGWKTVSRAHARVRRNGQALEVVDLASSNGTYVNGARLQPHTPAPLETGGRLGLGTSLELHVA